jgi:hypothetical protein
MKKFKFVPPTHLPLWQQAPKSEKRRKWDTTILTYYGQQQITNTSNDHKMQVFLIKNFEAHYEFFI